MLEARNGSNVQPYVPIENAWFLGSIKEERKSPKPAEFKELSSSIIL
jgi:hypothetical protein